MTDRYERWVVTAAPEVNGLPSWEIGSMLTKQAVIYTLHKGHFDIGMVMDRIHHNNTRTKYVVAFFNHTQVLVPQKQTWVLVADRTGNCNAPQLVKRSVMEVCREV